MKRNLVALLLVVSILVLSFSGIVSAKKTVLKLAHVQATDHAYHLMSVVFKEEVERLDPNIEVQIFPASQLGNERDLVEGLQIGTVDISTITSAITAGFVPGFKVFSLPFLFRDFDHMFAVMDGEIGAQLEKDMEKAGLIKLAFVSGGSRSLYSRMPIRNLADLKGKKIRIMEDPIYVDTWNALGALATPIVWGDVYLALQQGIVDGAEGAMISYDSMAFYGPSPHITEIEYVFSWHNFMMSKRSWQKLTEDQRSVILQAAEVAKDWERQYVKEFEQNLMTKLEQENGAFIYQAEDIEKWREAVIPVFEKNAKEVGGMELIEAILAVEAD